jgi:hypothetical protein
VILRWLAACCVVLLATAADVRAQSPWRQVDFRGVAAARSAKLFCVVGCPGDTNLLLAGFDSGGVLRSTDGGATWQVSMSGWSAPGASGFVFDPVNPLRVLGLASGGSEAVRGHGLYESLDAGATWRHLHSSSGPFEGQLVVDPSSYNRERGACQRIWKLDPGGRVERSLDGGRSWRSMGPQYPGGLLVGAPHGLFVYSASGNLNDGGIFRSGDGGFTFKLEFLRPVQAIAVSARAPDYVWAIRDKQLWLSRNCANYFGRLSDIQLPADPSGWRALSVSPTNPARMLIAANDGLVWFTVDAGLQWNRIQLVTAVGGAGDPHLTRSWGWYVDGSVWISGGNGIWIGRLDDGVFKWHGAPAPQPIFGGGFQFREGTDAVLLSLKQSQAVLSRDGGATWDLLRVDRGVLNRGAFTAFAADDRRLFVGYSIGAGPRRLLVSANGGASWASASNPSRRPVEWSEGDIITAHPTNAAFLFAPGWRSLNGGATWLATPSCEAVYTAGSLPPYPLVGRLDTAVMVSTNAGDSWRSITPSIGGFTDAGIDQLRARGYFASQQSLKVFESGRWTTLATPVDQFGQRHITTVAVDPVDPNIIYAGGRALDYVTEVPVVRSIDGGRSWFNFIPKSGDQFMDGPREVGWMRVNPKTRELWVTTEGFGLWIASPPN